MPPQPRSVNDELESNQSISNLKPDKLFDPNRISEYSADVGPNEPVRAQVFGAMAAIEFLRGSVVGIDVHANAKGSLLDEPFCE